MLVYKEWNKGLRVSVNLVISWCNSLQNLFRHNDSNKIHERNDSYEGILIFTSIPVLEDSFEADVIEYCSVSLPFLNLHNKAHEDFLTF